MNYEGDGRPTAGQKRWRLEWRENVGLRVFGIDAPHGPTIFEGHPVDVMPVSEGDALRARIRELEDEIAEYAYDADEPVQ